MSRYRVDVFDSFWNGNLINRLYIQAKTETEAREKAYKAWEKSLIVTPLTNPCFDINQVV